MSSSTILEKSKKLDVNFLGGSKSLHFSVYNPETKKSFNVSVKLESDTIHHALHGSTKGQLDSYKVAVLKWILNNVERLNSGENKTGTR